MATDDKATPDTKRKSGGARATYAKRVREDAARRRGADGADESARRFLRLVDAVPDDAAELRERITWLGAVVITAVLDAAADVGLQPQARREQVVRLAEKAMKVLEPAKLTQELDELYEAYQRLEARARQSAGQEQQEHAGNDAQGEDRGPPSGPDLI
jgi:hypothetical protein